MRHTLAAYRAVTLLVCAFLPAPLAGEEIELKSWSAPPYWTPPAVSPADGDHGGGDALATGRQALLTAPPPSPVPLPFVATAPCRQYDSRSTTVLPDNTPRTVTLSGPPCGIPTTAAAVAVNITVFNIIGAGSNGVFKVGVYAPPPTSWINYPFTETQRANAGVVGTTGEADIVVQVNQGAGSVDFVVDVFGYYSPLGIVNHVNTLAGDVTLAAGANVSIVPSGNTLTIASPNSGGTVTSVATGSGLTGGPITSTGTLSVTPLGITTGMLADGAVTGAKLAAGAVSTPHYPGGETAGAITSGSGVIYDAVGVNIGTSTKCLVTAEGLLSNAVPTTTMSLVRNTWRVNGTTTNHIAALNYCFLSAPAPGHPYYQCSTTGIFLPTGSATNTYDFGCSFTVNGGTYNNSVVFCHAAVICFP